MQEVLAFYLDRLSEAQALIQRFEYTPVAPQGFEEFDIGSEVGSVIQTMPCQITRRVECRRNFDPKIVVSIYKLYHGQRYSIIGLPYDRTEHRWRTFYVFGMWGIIDQMIADFMLT